MTPPSWHEKLLGGFKRTSDRLVGNLAGLGTGRLDDATLDDIEEALIASDLGPETATRIRDRLAEGSFERNMEELGIRLVVSEEIEKVLAKVAEPLDIDAFPRPQVILVIGVNGSGKTTTIAKLAHLFMEQDYGVMLAAGDTFRAAAIGQLATWAERVGVPLISGKEGGDAAGIVYEAVKQATATGIDVLIVDTAGRLQNKRELMDELAKIRRVLGRLNPELPHDVVLVLDATTGQNALSQIEVFRDLAGVTGLVMTKLDGTARGGVLVAAAEKYGMPIHAIGVGEQIGDLRPFDANEVARIIAGRRGRRTMSSNQPAVRKPPNPGLSLALDYGPLLIFFIAYKFGNVFLGTLAFMVAIVISVIVSKIRLGRVSPMLWLSAILVIGFGGLTLYFHDPKFIQIKPTVIYGFLSALLFVGVFTGRPLLKYVLEAGYQGLTERGWMLLSRNWAFFFLAMALLNEVLRASVSFDAWLTIKVWGLTILSLAFGAANIPMLLRHGLAEEHDAVIDKPPEG